MLQHSNCPRALLCLLVVCALTSLKAMPETEYRWLNSDGWFYPGSEPGVFLASRATLGDLLDGSPAVVEEDDSPFPHDWRLFRWTEGMERDPATLSALEEAGVFISPVLGTMEDPMAVSKPRLWVGMRFGDWEAIFPEVLLAMGDIVSVRVMTSPLGTESHTYPYFKQRLAPLVVEPPPYSLAATVPEPPPGSSAVTIPQPRPRSGGEPDLDGRINFLFRIEAATADDVFAAMERAATVSGVRSASPNLTFRGTTGPIIVGDPIFINPLLGSWSRDSANRTWIWSPPLTLSAPQVHGVHYRMDNGWAWRGSALAETPWYWSFEQNMWINDIE